MAWSLLGGIGSTVLQSGAGGTTGGGLLAVLGLLFFAVPGRRATHRRLSYRLPLIAALSIQSRRVGSTPYGLVLSHTI